MRVLVAEASQQRRHQGAAHRVLEPEGDVPAIGVDLLDHGAAARLQPAHRVFGGLREQGAGAGQVDAATLPHDHRGAESLAQLRQCAADRRLRDAKGFGRSCEMALGGDRPQQGERRGEMGRELRRVVRHG